MATFETHFDIMDSVIFSPDTPLTSMLTAELKLEREKRYGTIVAIRITRAKIFYDILDDYTSTIVENIDSCNVFVAKEKTKIKEKK